jgi:protein TonB
MRLRTSAGLSLLALAFGIAGTAWLSAQTAGWRGPSVLAALPHALPPTHHAMPRRPRAMPAPARHAPVWKSVRNTPLAAAAPTSVPALRPLSTPPDTTLPWDALRGHLDGRAVVHVQVDGSGRVSAASLAQTSGDPVLDDYALRSVRGWRFAVPPEDPDGLSGDLPMLFSSDSGLASAP